MIIVRAKTNKEFIGIYDEMDQGHLKESIDYSCDPGICEYISIPIQIQLDISGDWNEKKEKWEKGYTYSHKFVDEVSEEEFKSDDIDEFIKYIENKYSDYWKPVGYCLENDDYLNANKERLRGKFR